MDTTPTFLPPTSDGYSDIFTAPVPQEDGGRTYYRWRESGYNPKDGSYGRCLDEDTASAIIAAYQDTQRLRQ